MSAASPVPTTELAAINGMLFLIGMAPLNTLEGVSNADIAAAQNKLSEVSVAVQARGWWFNREVDYPMNKNVDGEITVAPTLVNVDLDTTAYTDIDVVQRGTRLYDRKNHTYVFTQNLLADVTVLLPYEELPQVARQYIYIRAARLFQQGGVGSDTRDGFAEGDEYLALVALQDKEASNADLSIFDNYDVARVLDRSA